MQRCSSYICGNNVASFQDEEVMAALQFTPLFQFDKSRHTIDNVAQKYLKEASESVRHLIPIKTISDGNCLFNSILCLLPDCDVSPVELRG